jgi:hypothetical protein
MLYYIISFFLISQGIGNQLLATVNGLLLSLITRRALTVKFPDSQRYNLDPVFDFDARR